MIQAFAINISYMVKGTMIIILYVPSLQGKLYVPGEANLAAKTKGAQRPDTDMLPGSMIINSQKIYVWVTNYLDTVIFFLKTLLWGPRRANISNFCYNYPWPEQHNLRNYRWPQNILESYRWGRFTKLRDKKCCIYKFAQQNAIYTHFRDKNAVFTHFWVKNLWFHRYVTICLTSHKSIDRPDFLSIDQIFYR